MKYFINHPETNEVIGEYEFTSMPGCSRIGISHGLKIYPEFRGKGLSKQTQDIRDNKAKELGYIIILSTTAVGNAAQEHRQEWNCSKKVQWLFNDKTGHDVILYARHLYDWRQNL